MFHITKHFPLCVLKSIRSILMETCGFRQHNPRFVQHAGSGIKQMNARYFRFVTLCEFVLETVCRPSCRVGAESKTESA
ncbi:hypothetical protein AGJ34_13390 [Cronobacter dublinensis subsp. dublinensis]|nr:hypothetical protein [Cronobacter dublinensis]EGT5659309.1 hypothetical protein [Cronobacter dublinensis subsp. dublinensis]EGT5668891.1 hypothetical protein [Cronobacter dublinensis subsp. dublinensis]EGT5673985.1 hypothetical protein [Cronobacter dublinensis subsp. dublinensis]EGT5677973.1 hypothetical protein [Cronobacter dublinensis subsp. dublinensis]